MSEGRGPDVTPRHKYQKGHLAAVHKGGGNRHKSQMSEADARLINHNDKRSDFFLLFFIKTSQLQRNSLINEFIN